MEILYEDNHIIVVVKPQNIPAQEDESCDKDMLTMVKDYIKETYNKPGNVYVGLVHRLDRPTGGIMVFAKTSKASARLSEQIREGKFNKHYLAVVLGTPKDYKATLKNYLKKNYKDNVVRIVPENTEGAKYAELDYEVLEQNEELALVKVALKTGRTHQIRVQLSAIGCPVYGDTKYGKENMPKNKLNLWAYELQFEHPTLGKTMTFKVAPPITERAWNKFGEHRYE